MPIDFAKLVHWVPVGGGSNDGKTRRMHPHLVAHGYTGVDADMVRPGLATGAKRFIIHNPAGTTKIKDGSTMDFDQFIRAADAGLAFASASSFVKTFRGYRAKGIEGIAYLGLPSSSEAMVKLRSSPGKWLNRFEQSVRPVLDARLSLMIDALPHTDPDSLEYRALRMVELAMAEYGGKLYGEDGLDVQFGSPATKQWAGTPGLASWNRWEATPFRTPKPEWPEIIMFLQAPPAGESFADRASLKRWMPQAIEAIQDSGYTPCTWAHWAKGAESN